MPDLLKLIQLHEKRVAAKKALSIVQSQLTDSFHNLSAEEIVQYDLAYFLATRDYEAALAAYKVELELVANML